MRASLWVRDGLKGMPGPCVRRVCTSDCSVETMVSSGSSKSLSSVAVKSSECCGFLLSSSVSVEEATREGMGEPDHIGGVALRAIKDTTAESGTVGLTAYWIGVVGFVSLDAATVVGFMRDEIDRREESEYEGGRGARDDEGEF